jgi:lipooligosaccharide transport system permease protein
MNTATFEGLYSAYTRMAVQNTYLSILATPLQIGDIVAGELLWCAVKGAISALAIILVASLFSAIDWRWQVLLALPVILLTGFSFGAIALLFTALSRSYDFFMYYFTLAVTPMFLFCGVFYPLHTLPAFAQEIAAILPLTHAVALLRPLLTGQTPGQVLLHVLVLSAYAVLGYLLAAYLLRRRLLS